MAAVLSPTTSRSTNFTFDEIPMIDPSPLSDEELEELGRFLSETEGLEKAMNVSTLDGFLTALVLGPNVIMPSRWLPWVWDQEDGKKSPVFENQSQAEWVMPRLMRHMNTIARSLRETPEKFAPLFIEVENGDSPCLLVEGWCLGFMTGVRLDPGGWTPIFTDYLDMVAIVLMYGTVDGWNSLSEKDRSPETQNVRAHLLCEQIVELDQACFAQRTRLGSSVTRRKREKVGRNAPCPCGSGKKFKHCLCWATGRR